MNTDLIKIKKYYGESMMHLCRELFPSILEKPGLLFYLIDSKFSHSRFLYDDIINTKSKQSFQNFIYGLIDIKNCEIITDKTPQELLSKVGYDLYECNTNESMQQFKKYYDPEEQLCTFRDPERLKHNYVFFAIKKNIDEINRNKFYRFDRQDNYGTSIISIQFSKGKTNHLSIKNRYNHSVDNPDATFNNNLEKIIPGLTYSFEKKYNLKIQSTKDSFELKSYVQAEDGKFYKYNMEINNIYYCPNNIIIDNGKVIEDYKDKSRYIFVDYFIIDMKEKNIFCYDKRIDDCFLTYYNHFKKVEIEKHNDGRNLKVFLNDKIITITLDKQNRIIKFEDNYIEEIDNGFLKYNTDMKEITIPYIKNIGDYFLCSNLVMKKVNLEKVQKIGNFFFYANNSITNLNLPAVKKIGDNFLSNDEKLIYICVTSLEEAGSYVLSSKNYLKTLYMPNVKKIGDNFLADNIYLENIYAPNLEEVGNYFLSNNNSLINLSFESLKSVGKCFFHLNNSIENLLLPNLINADHNFLTDNEVLKNIYVPKLETIGRNFLFQNKNLEELYLFSTKKIESDFLYNNKKLETLVAPNLEEVGNFFLYWNEQLEQLKLDSITIIGKNFMHCNLNLKEFIVPNLLEIGGLSLQFNNKLIYVECSKDIQKIGELFLDNHDKRAEIINSILKGGVWNAKGYCLCKR